MSGFAKAHECLHRCDRQQICLGIERRIAAAWHRFFVHTPSKCLGRGGESIYCTLVPSIIIDIGSRAQSTSALSARSLLVYIPHGFLHTPIISPSAVTNRSLLGIVWFIIIIYLFITYYCPCVSVFKEHCRFYRSPVFG